MKKYFFFFLLIGLICLSCSSSTGVSVPSDFNVTYSFSSPLVKQDVSIVIKNTSLVMSYSNGTLNKNGNTTSDFEPSECEELYKYLKSNDALNIKSPEKEKLVDVPAESITITYKGKSNTIELTAVTNPPANIVNIKNKIFDFATKFNKDWKKNAGFE